MDLNIRRDMHKEHERHSVGLESSKTNFSVELNSVVQKIEQQFSESHNDQPYDAVDGRYPGERGFETNETIGSDCSNRTSSVESWADQADHHLQGKSSTLIEHPRELILVFFFLFRESNTN